MTKVLVISEHHQDHIAPSTLSTLGAAKKLSEKCDVLYASDNNALASKMATLSGVQTVLTLQHPRFKHVIAEDLAPIIVELAKSYTHVLAPATTFGKNLLPRVAAMLNVAQFSDVTSIESMDVFVRPIYAGNAFERVRACDPIKILTIRTTAFEAVAEGNSASIQPIENTVVPFERVRFIKEETIASSRPELTSARIVISGGRGLKSADNFKMIESIADKLGAAIGATRAAVDAGFVPNDWQVGQTGKVVAPTLYIAIGISGAIQHLAGMKDSKIIVAINKDADAPIFQVADYGLVGDLFEILPKMEELITAK